MPLDPQLAAFADQAEVLGGINVASMWERLRGEFLDEYVRLERQGLSADEIDRALDAFMGELSEKPLDDLARKSSGVIYNQGRSAEILSQDVDFVVRSEVLDNRTCENCATLDGAVVEVGSDEFLRLMPPAGCLGGDRCRGFYIPVTEEFA